MLLVAHEFSGCGIAHRLFDSALVLVMCWTLTSRLGTDIVEELRRWWMLTRKIARVVALQSRKLLSYWIMGCHHDAKEHSADLWHESVAVRCVGAERGWAHKAVCWYKSRDRAYSTMITSFISLSYVVSRGRVAPVIRTPQWHPTQAATVNVLTLPPHRRQDSNQIALCLTVGVIEQSHDTAYRESWKLVSWQCCYPNGTKRAIARADNTGLTCL